VLIVCGALIATTGNAMAGSWAFSNWGFWPREGSSSQVAMAPDGEAVVVDAHFEAIRAWRHTPEEDFAGGTFGTMKPSRRAALASRSSRVTILSEAGSPSEAMTAAASKLQRVGTAKRVYSKEPACDAS
jgi:hypothetical protein